MVLIKKIEFEHRVILWRLMCNYTTKILDLLKNFISI